MNIDAPEYSNQPGLASFLYDEVLLKDSYGIRKLYRELTDPESIEGIMDIGANLGFFSLMAATLFPAAKRVAIEPCGASFQRLCENMAHLETHCVQAALGNGSPLSLLKFSENTGCNRFLPGIEGETIQSYSLGELFHRHLGVSRYILKIDCEGAEGWIVGDPESERVFKKAQYICMEFHETYLDNPLCLTQAAWKKWITKLCRATHRLETTSNIDGTAVWLLTRKTLVPANV